MANSRTGNVDRIDTTNTNIEDVRTVAGVKYVGAASGTAIIKSVDTGETMWEHSGDVIAFDEVCIRCSDGVEVEVTNNAVVYIYSKV